MKLLAGLIIVFMFSGSYARAEQCERVIIASYQGSPLPLGDVYYDRADAKFWHNGLSASAVLLQNRVLDHGFPIKELMLEVNPCDKSIWLYPTYGKKRPYWSRLGKLVEPYAARYEPTEEKQEDHPRFWVRFLRSEIFQHLSLEVLLHLLGI